MNDPSDPEQDKLSTGLRAAFGAPSSPPETSPGPALPAHASVLRILQEKTASRLELHLQDVDEESGVPVRVDDEARELRDPRGRYQVVGEIGRGGVGVVYKGRDQDLGRDVAMKVLRREHVDRPEILERFVEEAQIGGQLQHPGIVPVYEIGLQHGDRPYFAMKLVKGETLAELLARRSDPQADRRRFLGYFEQVCQTMAYAHTRRVVHRDLKPHNVMIGGFGEVQVVDWGFAKVLVKASRRGPADEAPAAESVIATVRSKPDQGSHSIVGSMMGTPAYMPPEQALGDVERMDTRSDVFGLGAVLCEILTGKPPYLPEDGDLVLQAARADLAKAQARIEQCGADEAMIRLCQRCLSPDPLARPESGREVAEEVAAWLSSVEERARQAQIRAAEARVRARSTVLLSVAAVLLLLLGGGGYLYLEQQAQARRESAGQRVAVALSEADRRLGQARAAGPADLGLWSRALDAALQAEQLAAEPDVAVEQRAAVAALLSRVRDERAAAAAEAARFARDQEMRQALVEARIPTDDNMRKAEYYTLDARRQAEAYGAAFGRYLEGEDVADLDARQAAEALRGDLDVVLAAGLHHWAMSLEFLARKPGESPSAAVRAAHLRTVATALDPDPWRTRLRMLTARPEADRAALLQLRAEADLEFLPVISLYLLASALRSAGDLPEARTVLTVACRRFPSDFACVFLLSNLCEEDGDWSVALENLRIARALRPDLKEVQHRLAMALGQIGDVAGEQRIFERLAAENDEEGHWHFHLGTHDQVLGRQEQAVEHYREALRFDPNDTAALQNIGQALLELQRAEEALSHYLRFREIAPDSAPAHALLGLAYTKLGRSAEAIEVLDRAVELDPGYAVAHSHRSAALASLGRLDEAIASGRRSTELDPTDGRMFTVLSEALIAKGNLPEAIAAVRTAIALGEETGKLHRTLGMMLAQRGDLEAAFEEMRAAIRCDPDLPEAHSDLGSLLIAKRQFDDAIPSLQRALELAPGLAPAHYNLGRAWWAKGEFDRAREDLLRAEELWRLDGGEFALRWLPVVRTDLQRLEQTADGLQRLLDAARGAPESLPAGQAVDAGGFLLQRDEPRAALRCFQVGFAASARLETTFPNRYNAACAAARAAVDQGDPAASPSAEDRAAWRGLALRWCTAELAVWREALGGDEAAAAAARENLVMMLEDPDFGGLRDEAALAALPEAEAAAWRELWRGLRASVADPGAGR